MARSKKPSPIPTTSNGLTKDTFHKFLTAITNTKQKVSDATTAHASEFKRCDALQIHPEALKPIQKLDRMSEEKRGNLLQAFDRYRTWMTWDAQLDLLEAADEHDGADMTDADDHYDGALQSGDDEEETERAPAGLTFASAEPREEIDPMLEETAKAWENIPANEGSDSDYDEAGFTFAAGRQAGSAGESVTTNPHPEGGSSHDTWLRGYRIGAKDYVDREAKAGAEELDQADLGDGGNVVNLRYDDDVDEGLIDGEDMAIEPISLPSDAEASRAAQ